MCFMHLCWLLLESSLGPEWPWPGLASMWSALHCCLSSNVLGDVSGVTVVVVLSSDISTELFDFCLKSFGHLQLPLSKAVLLMHSGGCLIGFYHSKYCSIVRCGCCVLSFPHNPNEYLVVLHPFTPVETQDVKSHTVFEFDFIVGHFVSLVSELFQLLRSFR